MTEQPIEPRDPQGDPGVTTPQPDPQPDPDDNTPQTDPAGDTALNGSDVGSDTRAGSLQGGAATGSERDPAQTASDEHLADLGPRLRAQEAQGSAPQPAPQPDGVNNTGAPREQAKAPGDSADAATS